MKHLLLLIAACYATFAQAQDVIVKRDGSTILSKVLEVNQMDIKYKKFSNQQGPTYTINKSEVMAINYEGGDKDTFEETTSLAMQNANQQTIAEHTEFTPEDQAANEAALAKWSIPISGYNGKAKDKKATLLYCVLRPVHDAVIADTNVELLFKGIPDEIVQENYFVVTVKNKTRNTIFVDLGNTFFIRGDLSEPYYIPTAKSSTSGTSSGVGVNLGAVSGAMGVGGSLGKLASGVNVGQGSSQYNTTITYSQRVIAIPPMSSKELERKVILPIDNKTDVCQYYGSSFQMMKRSRYGNGVQYPHLIGIGKLLSIGDIKDLQEGEFPVRIGSHLTYSFTEDIQKPRSLHADFDLRRIIGIPENKMIGISNPFPNSKLLSSQQLSDIFFIAWQVE